MNESHEGGFISHLGVDQTLELLKEKKIMNSSLKKYRKKLPIEKQKEWKLHKIDFYTTAQTNSFALFDDSHRWTFDPGGRA